MNAKYRHLLAKKSKTPNEPELHETLVGHILDVVAVANTLVLSWGNVFLASLGLPQSWSSDLFAASLRGAFLHDLGKANHQFQRLVRRGPDPPQALRHEWISLYILLYFQALDQWLFPEGDSPARKAALFAAVGHHLQVQDGSAISPRDGSGDSRVDVLTGHPIGMPSGRGWRRDTFRPWGAITRRGRSRSRSRAGRTSSSTLPGRRFRSARPRSRRWCR